MSDLEEAVWRKMNEFEDETFSFTDFVPNFRIDNKEFQIAYGTFRNIVSKLVRAGRIQVAYYSPQAFYYVINPGSAMTWNHTGVSHLQTKHTYRHLSNDPVYRIIQSLPFGKRSLHDIRLKFAVAGIWSVLSSKYQPNPQSKDLHVDPWPLKINDLNLSITVHATDTITIDIGCSYYPVAVDVDGVVRLSTALAITGERLFHIVEGCAKHQDSNLTIIPDHMTWIVTMWHFGRDALIEYKGEKLNTSWEVGQHALITAYIKEWTDGKRRVRIEKQEYPRKSLAEAIEDKLNGVPLPS